MGKIDFDKIAASYPVSAIVWKRVRLTGAGRGEFKGLCPFHQERTPSFTVSDAKGFWHITDESAGEVVLRPGLPPVGEFIVLVHELLHAMDDLLKANGTTSRRVAHAWIEGGAFGLATLLIFLGVVRGLTPEMWEAFVDEVGPDEMMGGAP